MDTTTFGFLCSAFNNGFLINYGHYYWNLTLGKYGYANATITLPRAHTQYYTAFVCARNQGETIATAVQPNWSTLTIVAFNNSADSRHTYGMWWLTVGY